MVLPQTYTSHGGNEGDCLHAPLVIALVPLKCSDSRNLQMRKGIGALALLKTKHSGPHIRYRVLCGGIQSTWQVIVCMPCQHCHVISNTPGLVSQTGHEGHALLPLVLALAPIQNVPIVFKIFQWKCPLQNENGCALSKLKCEALYTCPI